MREPQLILEETEDFILFTFNDKIRTHPWSSPQVITKLTEFYPYTVYLQRIPLKKAKIYFEDNHEDDGFVYSNTHDRYALRKNSQWTWLLNTIYFKTLELKTIAVLKFL